MTMLDNARDPNNATFYVLRYPADFGEGGTETDPFQSESSPFLSGELFHDAERHVTELRPTDPRVEVRPLPGVAIEPGGDVFRINREGELVRRACDGTETLFPCELDFVRRPAGLALDRRGWLYVADPVAQRVVVLDSRTGAPIHVLNAGQEPIDVAVAATGFVFVADRTGQIFRFSPSLRALGSFEPRNASDLPTQPRPIAVMVDQVESRVGCRRPLPPPTPVYSRGRTPGRCRAFICCRWSDIQRMGYGNPPCLVRPS